MAWSTEVVAAWCFAWWDGLKGSRTRQAYCGCHQNCQSDHVIRLTRSTKQQGIKGLRAQQTCVGKACSQVPLHNMHTVHALYMHTSGTQAIAQPGCSGPQATGAGSRRAQRWTTVQAHAL